MYFVLLYHAWNNPHETKGVIFPRTHAHVTTASLYRHTVPFQVPR